MTGIEKNILATVSYYDIFDYPLTGFELWRYLIRGGDLAATGPVEAGDMFEALRDSEFLKDKVSHRFGFYFLAGREEIAEIRLKRKKLADGKWRKIRRIFSILALVPYVRGIFVSGSLAMENSKEDSDVDIIVVAKHGRIWTVRTFMTLLTFLLGVRRYGNKTKDRICLNHYITDKSLRIPFESLYNAQSYAHLLNVYKEDADMFRRFQENNSWLGKYIANYKASELHSVRAIKRNSLVLFAARIFEFVSSGAIGNAAENIFFNIESRRIRRDPLYEKTGGRITIDDKQLEFHPDSHEYFIIPEFNRRMEEIGLAEFAGQKDSGLNG